MNLFKAAAGGSSLFLALGLAAAQAEPDLHSVHVDMMDTRGDHELPGSRLPQSIAGFQHRAFVPSEAAAEGLAHWCHGDWSIQIHSSIERGRRGSRGASLR